MKTDREFIDGIYLKAREYEKSVKTNEDKINILSYRYIKLSISLTAAIVTLVLGIFGYRMLADNNASNKDLSQQPNAISIRGMEDSNIIEGRIKNINSEKGYIVVKVNEITNLNEEYEDDIRIKKKIKIYYDTSLNYFNNRIKKNTNIKIYLDKDIQGHWFLIDIES
ncbi:MAG TPA: hypothetical protein GXZ90_09795 [Clostridiales bacterium]|nr:hypothetical protein [Clostridiales bacterium]